MPVACAVEPLPGDDAGKRPELALPPVSNTVDISMQLYNNGKLDLLRRNWGADIDQCATAATQNSNIQNSALTASQFSGLFAMVGTFQ